MSTCENLAINGKTPSIRKKYSDRKGPPYAAPDCKKQYMIGNDGLWYQSQKNSGGVWTWRKTPDYVPDIVPDIVPDVVESEKYHYSMTIEPRLLNCAYSDSTIWELDAKDRQTVIEWYKTRVQEIAIIYSDIVDSPVKFSTNQLGIVIDWSGPEDKKETMLEMIPEMFSDPDDDGNYPIDFYYPGASDELECLVTSIIVEQGFENPNEPIFVEPPKKKSVAEIRKECKERGLVYDAQLKDCRPSKRVPKVVEPVVVEPVVVEPVVVEPIPPKKKSVAEMRKECQERGMVYDAQLKDCRPSKRVAAASPEVKKMYRDTMELVNKLTFNIEKVSKSANALEELTEYHTLLSAMI